MTTFNSNENNDVNKLPQSDLNNYRKNYKPKPRSNMEYIIYIILFIIGIVLSYLYL